MKASISESQLCDLLFTEEDVLEALSQLKLGTAGISSEHLRFALSALGVPLASFLTSIIRHGYMPQCLCDSVLIPAPKSNKDPSGSQSYHVIAASARFLRD